MEPGSIVHTDLWRGYRHVENIEMVHRTVNQSQYFAGVHTNTIEGSWAAIKAKPRLKVEQLNMLVSCFGA